MLKLSVYNCASLMRRDGFTADAIVDLLRAGWRCAFAPVEDVVTRETVAFALASLNRMGLVSDSLDALTWRDGKGFGRECAFDYAAEVMVAPC